MNSNSNTNPSKEQTTEEAECTATIAQQVHRATPPIITKDDSNSSKDFLRNPFQRSSRLAHTPPGAERTRSAPPGMQHSYSTVKEMTTAEINRNMGDKITELTEMMELPKRNINQPMRDLIACISDLHKKLEKSILAGKNNMLNGPDGIKPKVKTGSTQTSPLIKRVTDLTSKRVINAAATRISPAKKIKRDRAEALRDTPVSANPQGNIDEWNLVKSKQTRKVATHGNLKSDGKLAEQTNGGNNRTRQRPRRKDAIVVKSVGSISYAEILKRVKTEPSLKELSQQVHGVKKTFNGELLLVLEKSSDPNTSKINEAVRAALGGAVEVRTLTELRQIEIRDLDEITTKEEVHEAICNQFKELSVPLSAILNLRKAYGGTQTATIKVPPETASKLTEVGKIRIGLVVCRIREKLEPKRCFKCMEYGHTAAKCKSPEDYAKSCFRCGSKDHQAKCCTQAANCMICKKKNLSEIDHAMTSSKCPLYQRALKELRKR